METQLQHSVLRGGQFLLQSTPVDQFFSPEDFSEEQQMVINMINEFIDARVAPAHDRINQLDLDLICQLIEEAGELGIIGITFPEQYGGSDMDFNTSMLVSELLGKTGSFSTTFGADTGIGMLPLLYFGTDEQKDTYLPDLVSGKLKAAYCLTEPGSGSDALAAKTAAVLSDDGEYYVLNGQKMWITNAGFADLFTVFAKVNGEQFTAFLVERNWEGISFGEEEQKMGIKGSSTRQVFFENVKVPVKNVLGEIGRGHKIAFNILNIGRIKLAAGAYGGSKAICSAAIQYANERKQFGQSISSFGAIQHKLAEMAIRIYVNETASYRASDAICQWEQGLREAGQSKGEALLGAAEEYAIECALMKIHSSEALDYVADEGVQIFGGMGFSEEAPMAEAYRDARINRIYEGTNEINRMLSMDMLLKRVMKEVLDFMPAVQEARKELEILVASGGANIGPEGLELVANLKKAFLLIATATVDHFKEKLSAEQEILMALSDMMGDIYLAESALLRSQKAVERSVPNAALHATMAQVFLFDACNRFAVNARNVVCNWAADETKQQLLTAIHVFTYNEGMDARTARRDIAKVLISSNAYCF